MPTVPDTSKDRTGHAPGDFAVVSSGGPAGKLIRLLLWLAGRKQRQFRQFQHAFIYIGITGTDRDHPLGLPSVIQAEPTGARERPLTGHTTEMWSTDIIYLTPIKRADILSAAHLYATNNTDYSFLDYASLALRRFHIRLPGLRIYIRSTGHMICSQLVDKAYSDGGVHLFRDKRFEGDVTPPDLADLLFRLQASRAHP